MPEAFCEDLEVRNVDGDTDFSSYSNNLSNAVRQTVDKVMNSNRKQFFERYVNLFAFGFIFIALALFSQFFLFMILLIFVGVAFIGYAGGMIIVSEWKKK